MQSLARQELVFDEGSGSSGSRYTQKGKSRGTLENSQAGDTWGWCDAEVVNVLHETDNVGAAFKSDSREGSVCTLRVILTPYGTVSGYTSTDNMTSEEKEKRKRNRRPL